jgi:hypothetical protein
MVILHRTFRAPLGLLGLLALLFAAGCTCPDAVPIVQDDFEHLCGELPCGWTASGLVALVTTYHAGEHAVALTGPGSLSTELSGPTEDPIELTLLLACDGSSAVDALLTPETDGGAFELRLPLGSGVTDGGVIPRVGVPVTWPTGVALRRLTFLGAGVGTCTLDDVRLLPMRGCGG